MKSVAVEFYRRSSLRCEIVPQAILTYHVGGNQGGKLEEDEEEAVEDHLVFLKSIYFNEK